MDKSTRKTSLEQWIERINTAFLKKQGKTYQLDHYKRKATYDFYQRFTYSLIHRV